MIDLYEIPPSPPCRAVKMLIKHLDLELNVHIVDLFKKEHLKPEFLEINPFHKVPVIIDDGFTLSESKAILLYLISKYDPDSSLYPKDLKERAKVDQMMYAENGTLFPAMVGVLRPQIFFGQEPPAEAVERAKDVLGTFNKLLDKTEFAAGNQLTLADFALPPTFSTFEAARISLEEYPNIQAYIKRVAAKLQPVYGEVNDEPLAKCKDLVSEKMKGK